MAEIIEGPKLAALSCGKPVYLVLLLHGRGQCGRDMLDFALGWAPEMIKADFLALETPLRDAEGRAVWFDGPETWARMTEALDALIDAQLEKTRLPASHLALVGFDQGARLALAVGLRRPESLAALVGVSGAYDAALAEGALASPPTLLIHGEHDPVALIADMLAFKAALKARGAPVWSFRQSDPGHAFRTEGAEAAGAFLTRHVKHARPAPA